MRVTLLRDRAPATWRVTATDGYTHPAAEQRDGPATSSMGVGTTLDAQVILTPGEYRLVMTVSPKDTVYQRTLRAE
ncbi:MAG: hypothetical protein IPK12_03920 [Gemmatimonadetes bacterium]|nr:hypothetical protein [Gemmatimonadota bacterium]